MDNTIWELREIHRCIGAQLVKMQNKRAVYRHVPAPPADPASCASGPFSATRGGSKSGVPTVLVNELIEEMDLAVLALRLCCVKIEIEREGLRGLLPPVHDESVAAPGSGGDQDRDRAQQQQQTSQSLGGSRGGSSGVSMAERPHPLFAPPPPQTQFRPQNNSNRNSHHGSSKQEYAGVEKMGVMKGPAPATTVELVFPKVEMGVGRTLKDQAAPYGANKTRRRTPQRVSYMSASGAGNTAKSVEVERSSAAEKMFNTTTTTTTTSRRQPAQAPAHPPPARTTSLALPRSKAGATRKITNAAATNSKKSPDLVPPARVSTPTLVNGASVKNHHHATHQDKDKDKEQRESGPHDEGDNKPDRGNLAESARRRQYHRQQVASMTDPAHAHARAQAYTQETQQQVRHQHRIGSGSGTAGDNQGYFDRTKGIPTRLPTTSKYNNKHIPGTGTHSPLSIGNGKFVDSTTSAAPSFKYSDHHHRKKKETDIPNYNNNNNNNNNNNTAKKDRRQGKQQEEEEEEHTRASREKARGGGGLQKEDRSSSFLGTVKGAIKGVFNGTMA